MSQMSLRHLPFEPFAGKFRAEVKLWMGPGDPHISTGTMINAFVLNDRYLEQRYLGDAVDGPFGEFAGHGFWGFDPASGNYQGFWVDTASSQMQMERGTVDESGRVWTMIGELVHPESGQVIRKRSVISLIDRDRHVMESYFPGPDGSEYKSMEITYVRHT